MTRLTRSMEEICAASEDTSKIIKPIDEIAFQTHLLALNAAVAEESASASEELNAQAEQLRWYVGGLMMVSGQREGTPASDPCPVPP